MKTEKEVDAKKPDLAKETTATKEAKEPKEPKDADTLTFEGMFREQIILRLFN